MVNIRYFGYLGGFLLVLTAALVALFGLGNLHGAIAVQIGLLVLAGLFGVASGFANPLRERVGALRLVGLTDISLGASMAASALTATDALVFRAVVVLGGACLALIGVNYLAGGRFFDAGDVDV